jgi:hypothetical protein
MPYIVTNWTDREENVEFETEEEAREFAADTNGSILFPDGTTVSYMNNEPDTVTCVLCGNDAAAEAAHLHQGQWIGDDCCWDERLKSTE